MGVGLHKQATLIFAANPLFQPEDSLFLSDSANEAQGRFKFRFEAECLRHGIAVR